ncbi:hypothetical protein [Streptomyces sp. NK15101]|uniref:hypothetical protein n=1 Tax=Streptomyces sp. NK15101 TaxID=2873261 RepID=UPI001CEC2841|nr:hypothetical protein [Streptomyces sp. NK15101]
MQGCGQPQAPPSRAGAVDVPLYRAADVDAHPEVDGEELRRVVKGQRSPLAALDPKPEVASA